MANVWPITLPDVPLLSGNAEQAPNALIRTAMDAGPVKVRRRTTAVPYRITFQMQMDDSELSTFITFWEDTIGYGAESFEFTHPRTDATVNARFFEPPSWSQIRNDLWVITLAWEVLP